MREKMMKYFLWLGVVATLIVQIIFARHTTAQAAIPYQLTVVGVHTSCTIAVNTTSYCFAADGLWQSLNGLAYTQIAVGAAGPAGPTGPQGPIGLQGPQGPAGSSGGVVSVNGKTGVVQLTATLQ